MHIDFQQFHFAKNFYQLAEINRKNKKQPSKIPQILRNKNHRKFEGKLETTLVYFSEKIRNNHQKFLKF